MFSCVSFGALALYVLIALVTKLFIDPFESYDLYKIFSTTGSIFSAIYAIMVCIVNPIMFKRVPKNASKGNK